MTTFYLIRHGQNNKVSGDQPLTPVGRRQAQATAAHLMGLPITAVYASPLARAWQTAQAVAEAAGLPVLEDIRLRERANFGDLPGQTLTEFIAMWEQCDRNRDLVPAVGPSSRTNGERLEAWIRDVYRLHPQGTIVAGTHGGTITDFLLNQFSSENLESYRANFLHNIGHCAITIFDFDGHRFFLKELASVVHLTALPHSDSIDQ